MSLDIQQALTVLGASGLVADDELARARQAPLGSLGITMAPRDDLRDPDRSGRRRSPREVRITRRYDDSLEAYRHVVDERAGRATGLPDPS
ncbi:MAG: hypothetical protein WBP59_01760 [Ilumatobacteraceae bacterium]